MAYQQVDWKDTNVRLATAIRNVADLREASWNRFRYAKTYRECVTEVVGNDPIGTILLCLFTPGYAEMHEFCDTMLGKPEQA